MKAAAPQIEPRVASWLAQACAEPAPHEALRVLIERFARHAGAQVCQVVRSEPVPGLCRVTWRWRAGALENIQQSMSLAGTATERALRAGAPVAWAADETADPSLPGLGLQAGYTAPLPGGTGSFGAYFAASSAQRADALPGLLAQMCRLLWPLLCWDDESGARASGRPAQLRWVHEINNALSTIVLHADLALSLHKRERGDRIATLLEQISDESIRCANIVRQYAS